MSSESGNLFDEIHLMNKKIIPCLINFIDRDIQGIVGFKNPLSSTMESFIFRNYSGINAAYLIEFILAKDKIEKIQGDSWEQKVKPYKLYTYGVIINDESNRPSALSLKEMKAIKSIYLEWWKLNKNKPIELLRKEWKEGKHILDNSKFKWI
ncbi:hypothetical protein QNI19_37415 [Cytophagaceae bacterium DM2B3-1]|uniref:Uncharacterized protein n=1 Tax=Xanthocytophaga flava TaxID=3048013 RepID=A0ABT7CY46_9BACT|nr:hypothetical protein [Xanthocytophaga flavus]MDJ1498672.1 hypothetical protein [Xanthocytophaga flavus]